jgi:transcriptional regulator with XRE-family HTH domain
MQVTEIGRQIRLRRKALQVSQIDLSEISKVSLRTIKAIEKGQANPTVNVLQRVLEPLGLTLNASERVKHE